MLVAFALISLSGCSQGPEAKIKPSLEQRANGARQDFGKALAGLGSPSIALKSIERGGINNTDVIVNWGPEGYDSATLSYPTTAVYRAQLRGKSVVVDVVVSGSVSQGGLNPHEWIGYSCVEFAGTIKGAPGFTRKSVTCPAIVRNKSFDGEGCIAITL